MSLKKQAGKGKKLLMMRTTESRSSFGKAKSDKYHQGEKWKKQRVRALRTLGAYLLPRRLAM